jgi:gliding motility-associated-like protein
VLSGASSGPITLNTGDNVITTVVTAQDGSVKKYVVTITRAQSTNAFLTTISYSPNLVRTEVAGPGFSNSTASVNFSVTSVSVTPVTRDAGATIAVNSTAVLSGGSVPVALSVGQNVITTRVTAEDGSIKDYIVTVTRSTNPYLASLTYAPNVAKQVVTGPDFADYTATVKSTVSSIKLTPTAKDPTATITVNGSTVSSGTASDPIALNVGDNTITTTVTTTDFVSNSYVIVITRQPSTNAYLASITYDPNIARTAVSGPGDYNYTATVDNSVTGIDVTPTTRDNTATITVNDNAVNSGSAAHVDLVVGDNTVTTKVTAQDGTTTKTYIVVITRGPAPVFAKYDPSSEAAVDGSNAIVVHQNVSPNGDGRGDGLVIDGIAAHPDNKLQIMSRSGNLVYEAKGYDNATKSFDGHSSLNGKLQVAGTYFYSLEYKDGTEIKHKTGYIILKY